MELDVRQPIVLRAGEGETIEIAGNDLVLKAGAADTAGGLGLAEYTAGPEFHGPPPHTHEEMTDMFYVLEGTLTMLVGDEQHELGAGSFALVPPGTVHTFSNPSSEPVRFLSLYSPGGFEQYFREAAAAIADGPFDPALLGEIASRYDYKPV